ncbi:MAG: DUF896 domain-containing protein [Clostridiales bacterium]|jgi:uncharacterized protein YnzC (UPF0291/DUF896 family)|nr:DUF896 domain-containing protein [Clostridiales bacterium]
MKHSRIDRINELSRKARTHGLSDAEKEEQRILRAEYLADFRSNLQSLLDNTYIREPDGTVHKLEKKRFPDQP